MSRPKRRPKPKPGIRSTAGGVIINRLGQILLITRSGQLLALPKGGIKRQESPADAALREVQEETGYKCTVVGEFADLIERATQQHATRRKTTRLFLMHAEDVVDEGLLDEEPVWVDLDEAIGRMYHQAEADFLLAHLDEIKAAIARLIGEPTA